MREDIEKNNLMAFASLTQKWSQILPEYVTAPIHNNTFHTMHLEGIYSVPGPLHRGSFTNNQLHSVVTKYKVY